MPDESLGQARARIAREKAAAPASAPASGDDAAAREAMRKRAQDERINRSFVTGTEVYRDPSNNTQQRSIVTGDYGDIPSQAYGSPAPPRSQEEYFGLGPTDWKKKYPGDPDPTMDIRAQANAIGGR